MQFDLILMDIQMPGMDGIRACELIHQLPHQQQTPVIAVTAHAMAGQKEKLLSAGMNDYRRNLSTKRSHNPLLRHKARRCANGKHTVENPEELLEAIHKLHGSCGYSGVPRLKTSASCWSSSCARVRRNRSLNRSSRNCWMRWIT